MRFPRHLVLLVLGVVVTGRSASAQTEISAAHVTPNLESNVARPLRYHPDQGDFVIEDGTEFFNRSLYGGNTAFRVDGGDKPEFVLYLPGRGGNLRLGIQSDAGIKWLNDAARIVARYRPGELLYEIRDPLLGPDGVLNIEALAYAGVEGLVLRIQGHGVLPRVRLLCAYGGINGQRGKRDGDIGTESVPISQWFQLRPEFCRGNSVERAVDGFVVKAKAAAVVGVVPDGADVTITDATHWSDPGAVAAAFDSGAQPSLLLPIVAARFSLAPDGPQYVSLQRLSRDDSADAADLDTYREASAATPTPRRAAEAPPRHVSAFRRAELPARFADAERHFAALRSHVSVETPDAFLNAVVGALNVAADAVWDEPQHAIMHGAIAWRTRLLGWRGPYSLDALGWHDRARENITDWIGRQNTDPISSRVPPPDEKANLARNEAGLHTNGDLSNSHYDMNLVFIDAVFRHLQWTGDLQFARRVWPVIERHLGWERRLFRRTFGPEQLPLYEAYAAIWASDDLQYSGGGAMHASAYNYYENRQAARLARLIGADPSPYEREAELLARGMRKLLWLPAGGFAECKDWLGLQRVHPAAALWTFYHTMDSEVPSPQEAWQMAAKVDAEIPHLPVTGPGVPAGLCTLATSDWMPYDWSINNVVMAEAVHGALGLWQAGRPEEAWSVLKGSVAAAMYMGISPGNVGSMSYLDVYRRESQRDFADGAGVLSRAIVEGLFGVKPDALARELRVAPGWPAEWRHAAIHHPDFALGFDRNGDVDTYRITQHFPVPMAVRLCVAAPRDRITEVRVNGQPAEWRPVDSAVGMPRVEIVANGTAPSRSFEVSIVWSGSTVRTAANFGRCGSFEPTTQGQMRWWVPVSNASTNDETGEPRTGTNAHTPGGAHLDGLTYDSALLREATFEPIDLAAFFNDSVTRIFRNEYRSPRSPFVSLAIPKQGIGGWAGGVNRSAEIDDSGLRAVAAAHGGRFVLPNGVPFATPTETDARNVVFTSQWDNYPRRATIPLSGKARVVYLLMAGSTNPMQSRFENGDVMVTYADGNVARLSLINPTNWWPIEQDYFIDEFQFRRPEPLPMRVDLRTGNIRLPGDGVRVHGGGSVPGGAATVLALPVDPMKPLRSLTIEATANDVLVGLMAVTMVR